MTPSERLDAVAHITMGQAPAGESYNSDGRGMPLIAGAGDFGEVHPIAKKFTTSPGKICQAGDIVLGIRATIGEKVVADRPYCLGRGVAGLRPRSSVDNRYLWHWLAHASPTLAAKAKGATFKQVNREDIGELRVTLPPLPEQRRIAEILDKADALRAKRRAALAQIDTLTQSIFLDMFGDPATNPKGWPKIKLSLFTEAIIDCPHSTPRWTEGGVVCLRTSNLTMGGWDWKDTRYVSEAEYVERSRRGVIRSGDIILSREGTVGIAAIVEPGMRLCMGQRLVQVRPKECSESAYLLHHLLHVLHPDRISQSLVGSTSQHLNVKELRNLSIPSPPSALQSRFAKAVRAARAVAQVGRQAAQEAATLFRSLQHRAFRGEL